MLTRHLSYNRLRAGAFPGEKVPEVGDGRGFALLLRRLSHPDAALAGAAQAGAAAAVGRAQREAQVGPALVAVLVLTVVPGRRRVAQAQEVVVGVELTHVADGLPRRDVTWKAKKKKKKRRTFTSVSLTSRLAPLDGAVAA